MAKDDFDDCHHDFDNGHPDFSIAHYDPMTLMIFQIIIWFDFIRLAVMTIQMTLMKLLY